jgi:exopolysaccharide production protein ExoY
VHNSQQAALASACGKPDVGRVAQEISEESVAPSTLCLWILINSDTWDLSVLYQDAQLEPIEAGSAEPEVDLSRAARVWQHYAPHSQHVVVPKAASSVPPTRHAPRVHATHPEARRQRHSARRQPGEAAKRLLDIVGALVLAVVLSPVLLLVGVALVRDPGPVIFRHARTGRHGRSFGCLKFRTMVPNAELVLREILQRDPELRVEWLRDHKLRNDPRVTSIGRFLRRTSLDELPQLWNVLKGDMSLVGPRPVVPEEWQRYGRHLDTYLAAKPGVTGLWQVMGRSDTCYRRRVALDSYYVRKRSLFLDIFILMRTVKVVVRGRGAC